MVKTYILVTEEQLNLLKTMSAESGESIAEIIRQAINEMIHSKSYITRDQRRKRALSAAGRFLSKEEGANVSLDHDGYLDATYFE